MHQDNVVRIRENYDLTSVLIDASIDNLHGFKAKSASIDFRNKSADFSLILAKLASKRRQVVSHGKDSFVYQALLFLSELDLRPAHIDWSELIGGFESTAMASKLYSDDLAHYFELIFKEVFIDKLGLDVNAKDRRGFTLLMHAIASPQTTKDDIAMLIQHGSDIQQMSPYCGRAIHFVNCENDRAQDIFDLLLSHGANPIEQLEYIPFQVYLNGRMGEKSYERISDFISVAHLLHDSSRRLLVKRKADDVLRVLAKYQVNHAMQEMAVKLASRKRAYSSAF